MNQQYGEIVKQTILNYCKQYYKEYNLVENTTNDIDLVHKQTKQKERLIGTFHLVGELFKFNLVDCFVIEKYINLLLNKLKQTSKVKLTMEIKLREQYIECLREFIKKVNSKLSQTKKDDILKKVTILLDDKKEHSFTFSCREQFMFMDIIDLF